MGNLIYAMGVSLDGFIADPDGEIDWSAPDEELHRFHNARAREVAVELYGRRLYETMRGWETREEQPGAHEVEVEFARAWKATPKVVFSRTLRSVEGNARLATEDPAEELARVRRETDGDVAVGGAGLAAAFAALDLVDEYHLFVNPVVLGGGTPFFGPLSGRLRLELVETQTFPSGVVYLRHRRARERA